MTRRYRGENSNIEDIAARFDKHLADPEPAPIRLTASASVVKLRPGRYQLETALKDLIRSNLDGRGGRPRLSPEQKKPRVKRYVKKAERERRWREIYALPDDERELWNR